VAVGAGILMVFAVLVLLFVRVRVSPLRFLSACRCPWAAPYSALLLTGLHYRFRW